MQITKIKKLKGNKYSLTIDNYNIVTFDNVILKYNLLYNKIIDEKTYTKILEETKYYEIYDKVEKYVLKKMRSEKQVKEYLDKLNIEPKTIDDIIEKLKKNNILNDKEYCRAFIHDSIFLSKKGINRIRNELLSQNIQKEIIESVLNEFDIDVLDEKLKKLIINKLKSNKKYSSYYLKQKVLNELIKDGYDRDKILNIMKTIEISDEFIIEKEFEKTAKKLAIKYQGKEFIDKLRYKMLAKGFTTEKINYLIEQKNKEE